MAQGGSQLDYQILHDLKQRFPEIPESVVSRCLLQNNNNLDVCCHLLAQESNRYLYEEYHSTEEGRLSRGHMLHINLGYPPPEGGKTNGVGRTLVHSSSDGHLEPQRSATSTKQPQMVFPEPHSAPATMAPSPGYNPFFMNEQGRSAGTPPPHPAPTYSSVPRYPMNPITVTLSQNIPPAPQALQIQGCAYASSGGGNTLYIRPAPSQSPQPSPWPSPVLPVYQPPPYPGSYPSKQMPQTMYHSPPPAQFPSPYSSPQHQIQLSSHMLLPVSPPTYPQQQQQPAVTYLPYLKNQMEIPLEGPQRSPARHRSGSPAPTPGQQGVPRGQGTLYISTSPSPGSPSRGVAMTGPSGASFHPGMYIHQSPGRPHPASSPQPGNSAYIKVSPGRPQRTPGSPTVEAESLLNMVDQGDHPSTPAPILPISLLPGNVASHINHMPRRSSSGSDDYAYTQALLLHQRARMERLVKELLLERQNLEQLKGEVNEMEYDLLQRRFHRVNSSSLIPRPEDMTRLRSLNRQLQIDIDCTLKETDLLQSSGKFDPKAVNSFYDNIQPGPVIPPKPVRKDTGSSSKARSRPAPRDEDFEGVQWNCDSCTFLNHPALNRCEQCEMPRYT